MQSNSNNINNYLSTLPFYKKRILCKAPFNSLRLSLNGNIQICCVNKDFILGKYPEIKIKDAWFSEKINIIRKHITEKDLSLGCYECDSQIAIGATSSVKAKFYNHLKINKNDYPSLIEFELDNNCNLECIMCNPQTSSAINKSCNLKTIQPSPYNATIVDEIEEFIPHLSHANFIGGEPFLIPIYYSLIEKMLNINPKIIFNISTNGTILNEKIKSLLNRGRFDLAVSIDSIKKETFELIRKNATLETVLENIEYFNNYCKTKKTYFSIWICPMKQNAYEIPELLNYFNNKEIPIYFNYVTTPHGVSLWFQSSQEINSIKQFYHNNRIKASNDNSKRFADYISQLNTWEKAAITRENLIENLINKDWTEISSIYFAEVTQYLNSIKSRENDFKLFQQKLNELIADKDDLIKKNIFLFLKSISIKESIDVIMSNNLEYINYYIDKNF